MADSNDLRQAGLDYLAAKTQAEEEEASVRALAAYKAVVGSLDYDDDAGYASATFYVKRKGQVHAFLLYEDGINSVSELWIL